jgi:hypothetical protein
VASLGSLGVCSNCGFPWSVHALAATDPAWWDVLMMVGLKYCEKVLICVLPEGFRIAGRIWAEARKLNRDILCIHLSSLPNTTVVTRLEGW